MPTLAPLDDGAAKAPTDEEDRKRKAAPTTDNTGQGAYTKPDEELGRPMKESITPSWTCHRDGKAVHHDQEKDEEVEISNENEKFKGGGDGKRRKLAPSSSNDKQEGRVSDDKNDGHHNEPTIRPKNKGPRKGASKSKSRVSSPMKDMHTNHSVNPTRAGIIQEVYIENFMCHRKLSVKLCRNVNFIHGQNGSGKSAILTAIQVCLGAGARGTPSAQDLKELVRKEAGAECSGAKLRVTLLNKGADGYKPEVYGDYITVERNISLRPGGFNGYKLLDSKGKEQSRLKTDLDAVLDQLNIQVENPVAVLDQEDAKKFLTAKPEDMYHIFSKATGLESLDQCIRAIENTHKMKKECEQFLELDKLEVEVKGLRANYGWSVHKECVHLLNDEMKTFQKHGQALEKRKGELTTAEQSFSVTDGEETELQEQISMLTEEAHASVKIKTQYESSLHDCMASIKQKERDHGLLTQALSEAEASLKDLKKKKSAKVYLARALAETKTAVQDLKEKKAAMAQEIESLQPGIREQRKQLDEITSRNTKIESDLEKVEAKLEDIVQCNNRHMEPVNTIRAEVEQMEEALKKQEGIVTEIKGKVSDALDKAKRLQYAYIREVNMLKLKKKNVGAAPPGEEIELEPTNEDLEAIDIVEPSRGSKHYKAKIQSKLKEIDQERRNMIESDPVVARGRYLRSEKELDSKLKQIGFTHGFTFPSNAIENLKKDVKSCDKYRRQCRSHIAEMTNLGFDELLNEKGGAGGMEFDHEEKRLNLFFQKDISSMKTDPKLRIFKLKQPGE